VPPLSPQTPRVRCVVGRQSLRVIHSLFTCLSLLPASEESPTVAAITATTTDASAISTPEIAARAWFLSSEHNDDVVDATLTVAARAVREI
jgi:hypothetical protein